MRPADGWVALEDASGAFERPAWAVRAMLEQGKLERRVEDGRTYVRLPRPSEPVPPAPTLDELATQLLGTLPEGELAPSPDPEPASPPAPVALVAPELERLTRDVADLVRAVRVRDALLVRAAQALLTVEGQLARPVRTIEPERPRRSLAGTAAILVLGVIALGAAGVASTTQGELLRERDRTAWALEQAARFAHDLDAARARPAPALAIPSVAPPVSASVATAFSGAVALSSSGATTLPAGFSR